MKSRRSSFLMIALEAFLLSATAPFAKFFMDARTVDELQDRLVELHDQLKTIQAKADAEHRSLTTEENTAMTDLFAEFEGCEAEIERRTRLSDMDGRLSASRGRRTEAEPLGEAAALAAANTGTGTAARAALAPSRRPATAVPAFANDKGKWGFRSFGEVLQSVRQGALPGSPIDPRFIANAAPTTASEGSGADGGFAIPPDFRSTIMEKVLAETSIIGRTDQLVSSSNTITIPKDETTPWQTSGGIQAYWEGEAQQKTASKVALDQTSIRLNKLSALVNVTDELLEDAAALAAYVQRKAPIKIDFKITDAIINGTGVGMPLGILNSTAKVKISKEAAQAAASVVFNNISKMWARLYSGCRANAVWLINQDIEPSLIGLQFPGTGTAVPVYLPPGGLSASPYGMLMGRPVIPLESCQTVGTEGDLILTDLQTYMTAMKVGGMRQDVSIHLYFDFDVTAFKFVIRVAGQNWWTSAITPAKGSNTRSCIVTLEDR